MEVVKVKTEDNKEIYFVANNDGLPVESVLKFKDNTNYARNTLRMYYQYLKLSHGDRKNLDGYIDAINDISIYLRKEMFIWQIMMFF